MLLRCKLVQLKNVHRIIDAGRETKLMQAETEAFRPETDRLKRLYQPIRREALDTSNQKRGPPTPRCS